MELTAIVADVLGIAPERVVDSARPGELENWDSVRHVHLIMRLEKQYGVSFDYAEMTRLTSVGDIRSALREKGTDTGVARDGETGGRSGGESGAEPAARAENGNV
ncbi:acyl carrier protein [Streptomyces malaysiensis]|uniref:acyl carrier protein n=1 Tax=Streptomyces malaysiensis TaxID=92644 RepID=UPI000BFB49C5|nr:acyl carrier protein [Streptomyces malaysiensis]QDL75046.1 acyl carrier protein [Streptomyces malaysiensis]